MNIYFNDISSEEQMLASKICGLNPANDSIARLMQEDIEEYQENPSEEGARFLVEFYMNMQHAMSKED
jgi:hypothetical protein